MFSEFLIGKTDFGVQGDESRFEINKNREGKLFLTVEVIGRALIFEQLTKDKTSGWSWIPTPPRFHLRNYPIPAMPGDQGLTVELGRLDYERFDIDLFLGGRNEITNVTLKIENDRIEILGIVTIDRAQIKEEKTRITWMAPYELRGEGAAPNPAPYRNSIIIAVVGQCVWLKLASILSTGMAGSDPTVPMVLSTFLPFWAVTIAIVLLFPNQPPRFSLAFIRIGWIPISVITCILIAYVVNNSR